MGCRRTCCASAAAEARGIGWLQKTNDLARRRRSAAYAGWAAGRDIDIRILDVGGWRVALHKLRKVLTEMTADDAGTAAARMVLGRYVRRTAEQSIHST
jgi:hypothetical protein